MLLDSNIKLVLAPFEISSKIWMTEEDLNILKKSSATAQWIERASRGWLNVWKEVFAVDGFNPFDTLAVGYLTHPSLLECETIHVEIKTLPDDATEQAMQGTRVIEKPYLLAAKNTLLKKQTTYCYHAKNEFKSILLRRLQM